ncbi:MAG: ATP-binding cassette domain-containing protein [Ruminococcus sp.]|nr:ATP-binding cassette domain-containing protein [Ruminococcus sp.]
MNYNFSVKAMSLNGIQLYSENEISLPIKGVTCVLGNNGCGKTTLLNHIIYKNPDKIVMIAQENDLIFEDISIAENIMLLREDESLLLELLDQFEMNSILQRKVKHISGGEKRIISLLRMFFTDKKIIFLDEPTNDLDYRVVEVIKKMIQKLAMEKSVLIVTHDDRILKLAEQIYHFDNKKLVCDQERSSEVMCKDEDASESSADGSNYDIRKLVRTDITGFLLYIFIILSILIAGFLAVRINKSSMVSLAEGQTNIASKLYASPETMLNSGYIPLEAYLQYRGKVDLEYLDIYLECLDNFLKTGKSFDMILDDTFGEKVLLGMSVNMKTNQSTYVMKEYQSARSKILGEDFSIEGISTYDGVNEIALTSKSNISEPIDFDLYKEISDKILDGDSVNQPVLYIILNVDNDILKQLGGNFYIKNSTTVEISKNISSLQNILDSSKVLAVMLLSSVVFYFLYTKINLSLQKKRMIILRNFGVPYECVKKVIIQKQRMIIWKIIVTVIGSVILMLLSVLRPEYQIITVIHSVICLCIGQVVILITHKIIKRSLDKVYYFGGIYEH